MKITFLIVEIIYQYNKAKYDELSMKNMLSTINSHYIKNV